MPREHKKRGRRAEAQKRKLDDDEGHVEQKRRRTSEPHELPYTPAHDGGFQNEYDEAGQSEPAFFGLLSESEQEYFRQMDTRLENNLFDDDEDRSLFISNIYKEVKDKELKMACSQSSSRLLERLISLSSMNQLKAIFQAFCGNFMHLVQHRFASHCCETLFVHSSPFVSQEILSKTSEDGGDQEVAETMENLFLFAVNELQGNIGFLMTDRFASHTLRILLLVLSGEPVDTSQRTSVLHSRKKEKHGVSAGAKPSDAPVSKKRVPDSFLAALETMIRDSVLNLDTNNLRALATHSTGNPMLQILMQLELTHFGKQRAKSEHSILRKLVPDDPPVKGTESATFLDGLTYDPVGSRLLETIISHAPGKIFKALYKESWKGRMGTMVRNDVASYVASTILQRLSKDDLAEAVDDIVPQIPALADRGRTAIIKTVIERCIVRDIDTAPIAEALASAYDDPESPGTFSILKLLQPSSTAPAEPTNAPSPEDPTNLHASLLAQTMLTTPGPLSDLIFTALLALPTPTHLDLARTPHTSHVQQAALTSPLATVIFRRKLIQHFYSHIAACAQHPAASHLVDAIYAGTRPGLAFQRERCAEELAEAEPALRASPHGRAVWRNWRMDLYCRRRGEWVRRAREDAGNDGFLAFPARPAAAEEQGAPTEGGARELPLPLPPPAPQKSNLQLARERFARRQEAQRRREQAPQQQQQGEASAGRRRKGEEHAVGRGRASGVTTAPF